MGGGAAAAEMVTPMGRRNLSFGGVGATTLGAQALSLGQSNMEDLDGIDTDGEAHDDDVEEDEEEEEDTTYENDDPLEDDDLAGSDDPSYQGTEDADLLAAASDGGRGDGSSGVPGSPDGNRRRMASDSRSSSSSTGTVATDESSLRLQSATTCGGALGAGTRRVLAPWGTPAANTRASARSGSRGAGGGGGGGGVGSQATHGARARSASVSVRPKRSASPATTTASSENLGNLGVFKVLGEAFMRRFNAYSDQVGARATVQGLVVSFGVARL